MATASERIREARKAKLVCETCGESFTLKQSRGHANMWGHYTFTGPDGRVNHSRYAA